MIQEEGVPPKTRGSEGVPGLVLGGRVAHPVCKRSEPSRQRTDAPDTDLARRDPKEDTE